jgi:hypothetical protein
MVAFIIEENPANLPAVAAHRGAKMIKVNPTDIASTFLSSSNAIHGIIRHAAPCVIWKA